MVISIADAAELKKQAFDKFSAKVHFHDGCSGQYFSLESSEPSLIDFIRNFFAQRNLSVEFSEDMLNFTIKKANKNFDEFIK